MEEDPLVGGVKHGYVSLRQWLDKPNRSVDLLQCLHIFRQIVETLNLAHSQGIVVHNVRPSCFVMSSSNHVSLIKSALCSSLGSASYESALIRCSSQSAQGLLQQQSKNVDSPVEINASDTSQLAPKTSGLHLSLAYTSRLLPGEERKEKKLGKSLKAEEAEEKKQSFSSKQILLLESNWYISPEEVTGSPSSFSSDVYRLGVILFELFCAFSSVEEKISIMTNLSHRVLPPHLLLKRPKEASFCLWLLHPQPSCRPKISEVLQSEFLNESRDNWDKHEAAIKCREIIEDQELLLEFLMEIKQKKQEVSDKVCEALHCLCSDIEVVEQQMMLKKKGHGSYTQLNCNDFSASDCPSQCLAENKDCPSLGSRKRFRWGYGTHQVGEYDERPDEVERSETCSGDQEAVLFEGSQLMKNFKKLETIYFLERCRAIKPPEKPLSRCSPISITNRGSVVITERSFVDDLASEVGYSEGIKHRWMNPFLEGLCEYLSFSKLKVRADVKQGDFLGSSNLVCSLSFDCDKEFFATAGVSRRIKVFECDMILNENRDIQYPVTEMANGSKLSSICWNSYIKSQIASSDFEGVVQVWDVTRSQVFMEMMEHEKRVWSVDFSSTDPMKLASGSDDGAVKLWNINQGGSIGTIKTKANVCCVQFHPDSAYSLAVGSADHNIYCYDLRNTRVPLFTLNGHHKTVSYVKFVDSSTLVSASTDNSLKLWDLSMCKSRIIDNPLQTFTGHMNVKNFVGLSVSDGYIATGSETNEVFIYHKAFPMPVLSFKFSSTDSVFANKADIDAAQFVSAVCWRGQSTTLLAANSAGSVKLLEMI